MLHNNNSRSALLRRASPHRWLNSGSSEGGRSGGRGTTGHGRGAGSTGPARRPPQFANPRRPSTDFGNAHGGRGSIQKPNFSKTFLEPAAKGELLYKHESGIPKLAARAPKSMALKNEYDPNDDVLGMNRGSAGGRGQHQGGRGVGGGSGGGGRGRGGGRGSRMNNYDEYDPNKLDYPNANIKDYLRLPPNYDSEDEYDEMVSTFDPAKIEGTEIDGTVILRETASDYEDSDDEAEGWEDTKTDHWAPPQRQKRATFGKNQDEDGSVESFYLKDIMDIDDDPVARLPKEFINTPIPLKMKGDKLEHFLEASLSHPTKYATVQRLNLHPESLRVPRPIIDATRAQPDLEFMHNHMRFAFVTGLPFHVFDEEAGDMENPIHRHAIASTVANLFGVESKHVFPANMREAYIGFTDKKVRDQVMLNGPKLNVIVKPLSMALYKGNDHTDFCKDAAAVIRFTHVSPTMSSALFAHIFFPAGSELGQIYGAISVTDVLKASDTTMLLKCQSEAQATSMLASVLVYKRLEELGTYKIQYFKAKRELQRFGYTGPNKWAPKLLRGNKMVVAGDVPSDEFFRCHASMVQIRGIDDDWTKEDLTQVFQEFSREKRDVHGSIEFITCARGEKTGRAYIGFDRLQEARAFMDQTKGRLLTTISSRPPTMIRARIVTEKYFRGQVPKEERPERTIEELLADLEWTNFVKKEDIDYLEEAGIPSVAIRDVFRVLRFQNRSFGPADQNMARERVEQEMQRGQKLREAMQLYVDTLKANIATPENPGELFKAFFMEGEALDYSIFDKEKERIKRLQLKRNFEDYGIDERNLGPRYPVNLHPLPTFKGTY